MLSEARKIDFIWPKYALISFDLEFYRHPNICDIEGLIFLKNSLYSDINSHYPILNDLIRAASLVDFSEQSFEGETGTVKIRENKLLFNISINQIRDGNDIILATYDSDLQVLELSPYTLASKEIPEGSLIIVDSRSTALHIAIVLVIFAFCFGFITVNLVLYFVFRNEPEVKATSVSVSIFMFLGCYLLVIFVPMLLLEVQPIKHTKASASFICNILVWLSALGLPFSLIFATLFVKMLRVYVIFCKPHSYKKKLFSNPMLFLYILAILSPNLLILFIWATVDEFSKIRVTNKMKNHQVIFDQCFSKYTLVWVPLLMMYTNALIIALAILAFKTSEIRFRYFRDTKATNAFAYLSIVIGIMTVVYWYFFYSMPITIQSIRNTEISLYTGHIANVLLCQAIIFVPKVFPPTKRWLYQNKVKSK